MTGGYLTKKEVEVLIAIERTGAGCSMAAILLTVLSYWFVKRLRTTPNLFLLFASIANAGASIASMMGYDGLQKGEDSTLCQSQAFIFEW
jgi:anti-sigma-K factor RskA